MKWFVLSLLFLVACSNLDSAIDEVTVEKDRVIADLQAKVNDLNSRVIDLADKNKALEDNMSEQNNMQQMVVGQKQALNDYAQRVTACESELALATERLEEFEKKAKVLQEWVDSCQETLGDLG